MFHGGLYLLHATGYFKTLNLYKPNNECASSFTSIGVSCRQIELLCNAKSQTNSAAMGFQFFYSCKLHDGKTHVLETFFGQVRACDVFHV